MNANLNQINDQFASASRQFADTAAQINRLALDNAGQVFGLQMQAIEQNVNAALSFWGELTETRDLTGLRTVWPRGMQIARENLERAINTNQEVLGRTLKANEAIAQVTKGQYDRSSQQMNDAAQQAGNQFNQAANDLGDQINQQGNKAGKHGNK
jgi:hypothetical protein